MMLQLLDLLVTIMRLPVWGSQSENMALTQRFPRSEAEDGRIMSVLLIQAEDSFHSSGRRGTGTVSVSHMPQPGGYNLFSYPSIMHVIHQQPYVSVNTFPGIQQRSVWDLCALNNAVLKGQEGDEERVNALVSPAWRWGRWRGRWWWWGGEVGARALRSRR